MTPTDPVVPATAIIAPAQRRIEPAPGEGRRARRGHITSYGDGRICSMAGCTTVLSIYNGGSSCAGHSMVDEARQAVTPSD